MSHCRHQLTDSHRAILLKIVYVALLLFIVLTFSLNVLSLFCKHEFENGYCHKCGYIYAIIIIGMMAFVLIAAKLANMTGTREYVGSVGWKK